MPCHGYAARHNLNNIARHATTSKTKKITRQDLKRPHKLVNINSREPTVCFAWTKAKTPKHGIWFFSGSWFHLTLDTKHQIYKGVVAEQEAWLFVDGAQIFLFPPA